MSVQFGKCNFDGKPVDPKELDEVRPVLAPYGPDGEGSICKGNVGILFRAFHTTKESRREIQPYVSRAGFVLTWDGRLDNREELIGRLKGGLREESTDLAIVAAAYESWNTSAFHALIGDWALSIWDPRDRSVILAKDFVGTRHLYYSFEKDQVSWCTILDPLVLFAGHPWQLEEEYIAGWLAFFPAAQLTPYVGIHAVPPSCFVRLTKGAEEVTKYWDFDPAKRIRYRTDGEYEEHFRQVFRESVRRRLRSDSPILAELSGGMDSSSIVCMADQIADAETGLARVTSISYYSDAEPNWNERPYFETVEEKRGCKGIHVEVMQQDLHSFNLGQEGFVAIPAGINQLCRSAKALPSESGLNAYRVLLSGNGGDEVCGGVPTPLPELRDLIATGCWKRLASQIKLWAISKRKPWAHLLWEAIDGFIPPLRVRERYPAPWLRTDFISRNRNAFRGYEKRIKFFGPLPSFQESLIALEELRRQLACESQSKGQLHEKRYPFLDRDLAEFLYSIPREQLVRPGQRRSLLRRALYGIVPDAVLNRRRKAYVYRTPAAAIVSATANCANGENMLSAAMAVVEPVSYKKVLISLSAGEVAPIAILMRTLLLELWLRNLPGQLIHFRNLPDPPIASATANVVANTEYGIPFSIKRIQQKGGE